MINILNVVAITVRCVQTPAIAKHDLSREFIAREPAGGPRVLALPASRTARLILIVEVAAPFLVIVLTTADALRQAQAIIRGSSDRTCCAIVAFTAVVYELAYGAIRANARTGVGHEFALRAFEAFRVPDSRRVGAIRAIRALVHPLIPGHVGKPARAARRAVVPCWNAGGYARKVARRAEGRSGHRGGC